VTTDDQRMRTPEGSYRHLSCQPLPDLSTIHKGTLVESNMLRAMVTTITPPPEVRSPASPTSPAPPLSIDRERSLEEREKQLAERERAAVEKQKQIEQWEEERKGDLGRPRKPSPSPTRPVAREGIHLRPATVGVECEFVPRHGVVWGGMLCAKCGVRRKDHRVVPLKPEGRR